MVCSLFGVGGGLGIYDQWFTDYSPSGTIEGKWESWRIDETDEEVERLYLHPSILFKTPNILCLKDVKMSFQLEPGLICVFPYAGVHIDYVNSHSSEEIADIIKPQFKETDKDSLVRIIERYKNQDSWKEDVVFTEESFELLQDVLEDAGQLKERVPYDKLVDTDIAKKVVK